MPTDRTTPTLELIIESAQDVGFLRKLNGQTYVDLEGCSSPTTLSHRDTERETLLYLADDPPERSPAALVPEVIAAPAQINNRVFITHGKNKDIVGQLKELLTFGNLQPVVAVEHETVSKPVPDKVMDEMRSCEAAIIHVGPELKLLDDSGSEHRILNQNVLLEIGAAMALYRRNFISWLSEVSLYQAICRVSMKCDTMETASTMRPR